MSMIESHTPPAGRACACSSPLLPPHSLDSRYLASLATFACLGSHPPSAKKVVGYGFEKKKKIDPQQVQIPSYKPSESEWGHEPEPAPRLGEILRGKVGKTPGASRSILRAQEADRPDRSCCARGGHGGPRLGRQRGSVSFSVSTTSGTSSRSPSQVRNCLFFLHLGEAQLP